MEYTWKEISKIISENHPWCEVHSSDDLSLKAFSGFGVSCIATPATLTPFTPDRVREEIERFFYQLNEKSATRFGCTPETVSINDNTIFEADVHMVDADDWEAYVDISGGYAWEWGDTTVPIIMISEIVEPEEEDDYMEKMIYWVVETKNGDEFESDFTFSKADAFGSAEMAFHYLTNEERANTTVAVCGLTVSALESESAEAVYNRLIEEDCGFDCDFYEEIG